MLHTVLRNYVVGWDHKRRRYWNRGLSLLRARRAKSRDILDAVQDMRRFWELESYTVVVNIGRSEAFQPEKYNPYADCAKGIPRNVDRFNQTRPFLSYLPSVNILFKSSLDFEYDRCFLLIAAGIEVERISCSFRCAESRLGSSKRSINFTSWFRFQFTFIIRLFTSGRCIKTFLLSIIRDFDGPRTIYGGIPCGHVP